MRQQAKRFMIQLVHKLVSPSFLIVFFFGVEIAKCEEEEEYVELLRGMRSYSGFLGENESFLARLQQDFEIVYHELKTSHKELASHLKKVKQICLIVLMFHNVLVNGKMSNYVCP